MYVLVQRTGVIERYTDAGFSVLKLRIGQLQAMHDGTLIIYHGEPAVPRDILLVMSCHLEYP